MTRNPAEITRFREVVFFYQIYSCLDSGGNEQIELLCTQSYCKGMLLYIIYYILLYYIFIYIRYIINNNNNSIITQSSTIIYGYIYVEKYIRIF